jgi:hypothetical protein
MRIPSSIIAGDSAQWQDVAFQDGLGANVGSADYALTYSLRGPGPVLDLTGTSQGTGWAFSLTPEQSAPLNPGPANAIWYWQAYATKTGVRLTAGDGTLVVRPNLAGVTTTFDGSSPAEKILKAIETEIAARINGGATVEYTIGTRSLKKEPLAALLALRSTYRTIVSRERRGQMIKNGLGNPGRVGVRFK